MATLAESTDPIQIPAIPSPVKDFIPYLSKNLNKPVGDILEPYKAFEGELRKVYAREPSSDIVKDGTVNLVPIFAGHENELKIRARSLDTETDDEKSRYIMSLKNEDRKPNGAPAVVASFKDFQNNFNLFSESSLSDLDWNNIVAAGSAVTTSLLPIPQKHAGSKKAMREYYHRQLAPASDVDLFLYGLNEEQALEKIKQIERSIKDSILHEVTVIRTKNAITIASQYPTRHVQIVLRLYDSISQIITGFDVDCACAAYNGTQVYAAPRAIAAFVTQTNTIDLTRRSPSYENRLSKYSHRGFEVNWPLLDRTRIDPTIFERSFGRTQGLARLLILEKLPKTADRDKYMDQRRAERGRPAIHRGWRDSVRGGNIKEWEEDEVAEWVDEQEVASYHTMTVPYGEKYNAAKINRLLYAKDLLLNADWNHSEDRKVYLHRHPCFFGTAEEVLEDCCGYCPVPKTDEEIEVAEEEKKTYISGKLEFVMDDPGRQEIGSFNPITDDEWTTMAYVGDTARLCQAIVDGDLEHVQDWCAQEGIDVNRRDYTGRTPLHLATMASTPEVVQCLINNGARLIARLVDGRTALHIAAARGNTEMVKALMNKSLENEADEDEKQEARRAAKRAEHGDSDTEMKDENEDEDSESEASELTLGSEEDSDEGSDSMTMGSFVKVDAEKKLPEDAILDDSGDEPDIYEVDIISWDYGLSPLHFAIVNGHLDVIELLVSEYGADVLLPVKIMEPGSKDAKGAIMTLLLALSLPTAKAKDVVTLLLKLGATSAQADMNRYTTFHYVVNSGNEDILDLLVANDKPVALSVLNNVGSLSRWDNSGNTPLITAIEKDHKTMISKLLALGAKPTLPFDDWIKTYLSKNEHAKNHTAEQTMDTYKSSVTQPIIQAAAKNMANAVKELLAHGADPLTLDKGAHNIIKNPQNASYQTPESLLDVIQAKLKLLKEYELPELKQSKKPEKLREESSYTYGWKAGTYQHWSALRNLEAQKTLNEKAWKDWEEANTKLPEGIEEKKAAIAKLIAELEDAEKTLIKSGAKTFYEMYPDTPKSNRNQFQSHGYQPHFMGYETNLSFQIPDLNDTKKDGYFKLFQAAWDGDLETVKAMTLAPWEWRTPESMTPPLKIAVRDGNGFSPFSIAVLRGHYDLARKCIEICIAQYHKDDGLSSRQRWRMKKSSDEDEDMSDYDHDDENEDELPILGELVSDTYTIDNIGEVSNIVKSDVLPLQMIEWPCKPARVAGDLVKANDNEIHDAQSSMLDYAVKSDNMKLLKFIMEVGAEQTALQAENDDDQTCYTMNLHVFYQAIKLGRTAMLGEMIQQTGIGIPMNALISTSGLELKTKPKHYQGLSVGGKKRADWAQAPGGNIHVAEDRVPPLLSAAHEGSIESVEWFMSDAPMRRYKEFAERNKHDKRIKTLEGTSDGFDKTIGKWMSSQSELVLHCAILFYPGEDKSASANHLALIKHLISVAPETLSQQSSEGWTPLHIAILREDEDIVSFLLSKGVNQRHRDRSSRNIVHNILVHQTDNTPCHNVKHIQTMLDLLDKDAVKEMMLERCTQYPGASTPLAYWMSKYNSRSQDVRKLEVISLLAKYSTGEELEMINGEGDLPLHVAVKNSLSNMTSLLLSLNNSLLYRENSTGRTPLEMARDMFAASNVENHPDLTTGFSSYSAGYHARYQIPVLNKSASQFVVEEVLPVNSKKRTWEICDAADQEMAKQGHERKRRLVSLFEANEVAKRVAGFERGFLGGGGRQMVINGGLVGEEGRRDVVSEWLGQ